jgi:copper resistance protein D
MDTLMNFFHLLAAAIWIGGAVFIKLILEPSLKVIDPPSGGKLMGVVAKRFSITAWASLLIIIITGIYKTPSDMYFSTGDDLEIYLTLKHIATILVLIVGIIIAFAVVPKMRKAAPAEGQRPTDEFVKYSGQLHKLSLTSTILALIILLLASMLW